MKDGKRAIFSDTVSSSLLIAPFQGNARGQKTIFLLVLPDEGCEARRTKRLNVAST